jgi:HPt (histidine-containing phosphotransfer) domain-containing protein
MLDRRVIDQLIADIGEEVLVRLSQQFLDETANRIAAIKACQDEKQWKELARHAHSLKSTAQSFGLQETGDLAAALQFAGDLGEVARLGPLIADLTACARRECEEFAAFCDQLASERSQL